MTDDEIRFPTLGDAIAGRLTAGVVKGAVALLLAWISTLFIDVAVTFDRIAVALVLAFVLSEIVGAIIERPIVLRERRSNPGGFAYVFLAIHGVNSDQLCCFLRALPFPERRCSRDGSSSHLQFGRVALDEKLDSRADS